LVQWIRLGYFEESMGIAKRNQRRGFKGGFNALIELRGFGD